MINVPIDRSLWREALDALAKGRPPSKDAIAARAYEKHLANSTGVDRSVQNWLDAERELLAEIRSRV